MFSRPYICLLTNFSLLTWSSTCQLDQGSAIAARTAAKSFVIPLVNEATKPGSVGRPGKGNEKGKVEGLVGNFRRNFMTPLPVAECKYAPNIDAR